MWGSPQLSPQRAVLPFSMISPASVVLQVQNALTYLPAGESTRSPRRAQRSLQLLNNQKALQITAMPKRRANQISFESYKEKQKLKALILNLKTMHMYEPH